MPTNLAIDDRLLLEAQRIGAFKTKKAAVTEALKEFIRHRKQQEILKVFGTIDFDPKFNHKTGRHR
jgi:Arc/MetJ family transcription regulator